MAVELGFTPPEVSVGVDQRASLERNPRSLRGTVVTVQQVFSELIDIIPNASQVDLLFLNALGGDNTPLGRLVPFLKQAKKVRLGVSGAHREHFPQGEALINYKPGVKERAEDEKQMGRLSLFVHHLIWMVIALRH